MMSSQYIVQVQALKKYFPVTKGFLFMRITGWIKAVDGIDFAIRKGETFGLVGESGCGKTTTGKVILRLEKPTGGRVLFDGKDITSLKAQDLAEHRHRIQAVFQDPYSSMNPRLRAQEIISEPLVAYHAPLKEVIEERVAEVLNEVGLPPDSASFYPHEFSGGMRQRLALARALITHPDVIILDEPVSALDISIRAQILNLLKDLQERLSLTYLVIAHDLSSVQYISDRVGVMYSGRLVETANSIEIFAKPLHPYTKVLISAALPTHLEEQREESVIIGEVPSQLNVPRGCRFHPRCPYVKPICSEVDPPLRMKESGHEVACHLYE